MRRLTAIMCMVISGSGGSDHSDDVHQLVRQHKGELIKRSGAEYFASFDSAIDAVNCAFTVQQKKTEFSSQEICIGIHIGDLHTEDGDIFGSGVEGASEICQQVPAGGVCISRRVFESHRFQQELTNRPGLEAERSGEIGSEINKKLGPVYKVTLTNSILSADQSGKPRGKRYNRGSAILVGGLLISLLGLGIWWFLPTDSSTKPEPSVAVLPFEDFSQEGDQQWFSDGLTEEILNSLVRLDELYVPARTSSFYFKNKNIPIQQIADRLNVNHIVEGSVRRSDGRMRIAVQLIEAESGGHLWSKTYDRSTDSVFVVQKDIAENIAATLDVYLDDEQRERMFAFGTSNVKAYEAFLKGEQVLSQFRENKDKRSHWGPEKNPYTLLWKANEWYDKAIGQDSTFALPYHQRTITYFHIFNGNLSPSESDVSRKQAYELIQTGFRKSIRYSNNPGNRLIYRFNKAYFSKDWSSIPDIGQKIHKNPDAYRSFVLTGGGLAPEGFIGTGYAALAHRLYTEKLKDDPLNDLYKFYDVEALISLGRAELALGKYKDYLNTDPILKAGVLVHAGRLQKARQILANMNSQTAPFGLELYKILLGMKEVSKKELETYEDKYVGTLALKFYASAGYQSKADSLARKIDQHPLFTCKKHAPSYGNIIPFHLDATPNFARCLKQANLRTKSYNFGGLEVRRIVQKQL